MPRIPVAEDFQHVLADSTSPIATASTASAGRAAEALGGAAHALYTTVNTAIDANTRYQYAQAASEFMVKKAQQDNAYHDDQDYTTIQSRYSEAAGKALQDSAALISDPRARTEFVQKMNPELAVGVERIKGVAANKEKDYQRGYLTQQLSALADTAMSGNLTGAIDTGDALSITARDKGYITDQEYAAQKKTFRQTVSERALKMLSPEERLKALDLPAFQDNLPLDTRVEMQRQAVDQTRESTAVTLAGGAMSRVLAGEDVAKVTQGFDAIKDPITLAKTQDRFATDYARYRTTQAVEQESLHKKYALPIMTGQITFDQMTKDPAMNRDLQAMRPEVLQNLKSIDSNMARGVRESDRQTLLDLHALRAEVSAGRRPGSDLYDYFVANSSRLNPSDFDQWSGYSSQGMMPPKTVGILNAQEKFETTINQVMPELRDKNTAYGGDHLRTYSREKDNFDYWVRSETERTGHAPDEKTIDQHLDRMVLRTVEARSTAPADDHWYGRGSQPWEKLSPADQAADLNRIQTEDPAGWKAAQYRAGIRDGSNMTQNDLTHVRAAYERTKTGG